MSLRMGMVFLILKCISPDTWKIWMRTKQCLTVDMTFRFMKSLEAPSLPGSCLIPSCPCEVRLLIWLYCLRPSSFNFPLIIILIGSCFGGMIHAGWNVIWRLWCHTPVPHTGYVCVYKHSLRKWTRVSFFLQSQQVIRIQLSGLGAPRSARRVVGMLESTAQCSTVQAGAGSWNNCKPHVTHLVHRKYW